MEPKCFMSGTLNRLLATMATYVMRTSAIYVLFRSTASKILLILAIFTVCIVLEVSWTKHENIRSSINPHVEFTGLSTSGSLQDWPCIDRKAIKYDRVEDVFCIVRTTNGEPGSFRLWCYAWLHLRVAHYYGDHVHPYLVCQTVVKQFASKEDCLEMKILPRFLTNLKNPCFYDLMNGEQKKLRCLPYFYIIGMDKSGSTDLHSRLTQHPYVMGNKGSLGKETSYWSWFRYGVLNKRSGERKMPLEVYIEMFAETALLIEETNMSNIITGDATPMDLWDFRSWPMIPQNKGREEPQVLTPHLLKHVHGQQTPKFIIQFREPMARLYSDYIFLNYGKDPLEFHNHSLQAIDMINECLGNHTRRFCFFSYELYHRLPTRIHLGCYSVYLQEWFSVFPRSAFLITRTDEYQVNMLSTLSRVFEFLDLPSLPDFNMAEILNQTRRHVTKNKYGDILPETIQVLRDFYHDCNKETAELLKDNHFLWLDHYT